MANPSPPVTLAPTVPTPPSDTCAKRVKQQVKQIKLLRNYTETTRKPPPRSTTFMRPKKGAEGQRIQQVQKYKRKCRSSRKRKTVVFLQEIKPSSNVSTSIKPRKTRI